MPGSYTHNYICIQHHLVFNHAAMEEEIVEISHSIVSLVLANREPLFKTAPTTLSQGTLLEAATFEVR